MGEYAELHFAEKEQSKFKNMFLRWRPNLKYEEQTIWGQQGKKVQMPMTYTGYRQMPIGLRTHVFENIERKLHKNGITHVILPKSISTCPFKNIQMCIGDDIKSFFIMEVIHFIVKESITDKELHNMEVVILDGNKTQVDILIDLIYPYINNLAVITTEPERFKQKSKDIFDDVGLNMQVLSYTKGAISQGDIIIDTHCDDPTVIHLCKEKAVYLDIGNNAEKTAILLDRQRNVFLTDKFLLEKDGEVLSLAKAELILTMNGVFARSYIETMKRLKKYDIKIYKLIKQT